jgi:hypothetical protein
MYEPRDVGSFLIMLAVLPLFAVVFVLSLVIVAPILGLGWLLERWRTRRTGAVQ